MLFNSYSFLLFFPIVVLLYFVLPHKLRWVWLLVTSYYFYMSWNAKYVILLSISIIITWVSGLLIDWSNKRGGKHNILEKKMWVGLSVILNLAILCFFKYMIFFIGSIAKILNSGGGGEVYPSHISILFFQSEFRFTHSKLSVTR